MTSTPRFLHRIGQFWRKLDDLPGILKALVFLRHAETGRGIRLNGSLQIQNRGTLKIGAKTAFHRGPIPGVINVERGATLSIGEESRINFGCVFHATKHLEIGNRCRIGHHVFIMDSPLHEEAPSRRHLRPEPKPIIIGDDVWIASRVSILAGVTIGAGSIVGAGSVVSRDVPPMTIVAGNPARVIREVRGE
jgi:maltose O-acetyltransferase